MVGFESVYTMLESKGQGKAISDKGRGKNKGKITVYRIEAQNGNIVAFPRKGRVIIHRDCWGNSKTCQGSRAGGIYNGTYSIFDWYNEQLDKEARG